MPLTVGTDLVSITNAESTLNWVGIGAGGSLALEPDFSAQGSNSISRAVSGAATEKGMWYDLGAGATLNFNPGGLHRGKLVYVWLRCNTPTLIQTMQNGGLSIWIGSTTVNYNEYYVGGSDYGIPDSEGWVCYVIDPTLPASKIGGTGADLSALRYFGATIETTAAAKGQNIGIDRISYGKGLLTGSGASTSGSGFSDFANWDWGTKLNRYGLITVQNGIIFAKCKFVIGATTGSAPTTFTSNNETIVWETPMYMTGTNRAKSMRDVDVSGSYYWGIEVKGNSAGDTNVTFGTLVGTDQGRSGDNFSVASNSVITSGSNRTQWRLDGNDGSVEGFDVYGTTFKDLTATSPTSSFDYSGLTVNDKNFSNFYDGCGRISFGAMQVRNCTVLNSVTDATDGAVLWDSNTNIAECSFINNSRAVVFESTTGTPFEFQNVSFDPSTNAVRNESNGAITINITGTGGTVPTAENAGTSTTTIASAVSLEVNGVTEGTRCSMIASSGSLTGQELLGGYASSAGSVTSTFTGSTPQQVIVKARNSGIVAAVIQDDGGVYTNYTNDARDKTGTSDIVLLPAIPALNDAVYIGGFNQFSEIEVKITSPGTTYSLTWEYFNGSWVTLTATDSTNSLQTTGWGKVIFTAPSNWTTTTINSQGPYYYVRGRVTTGGGTGVSAEEITLSGTTKYLPFTLNGTITGTGLSITAVWIEDSNAR